MSTPAVGQAVHTPRLEEELIETPIATPTLEERVDDAAHDAMMEDGSDKAAPSPKISAHDDERAYTYINDWKACGGTIEKTSKLIQDPQTNEIYEEKTDDELRAEHAKLIVPNFVLKTIQAISQIALVIFHFITFQEYFDEDKDVLSKVKSWIVHPFTETTTILVHYIKSVCAPLFGLFKPNDGRKLYHHLEVTKPDTGFNRLNEIKLSPDYFHPVEFS